MDDGAASVPLTPVPTRNPFKRLYAWILSWAHHPMGTWALGFFAFVDSSVFPIPPLFLQVALSLERPKRSWWYATVDLVGSVLGAMIGFLLGTVLWNAVGKWVIDTWGLQDQFNEFGRFIQEQGFWFTFVYSFLPFPYKVITIGTGFFGGSLATLLIASSLGRALRFYALAAVCFWGGTRAKGFIERHFNKVLFAVGLFVLFIILLMKVWFAKDGKAVRPEPKTGGVRAVRVTSGSAVSCDPFLFELRRAAGGGS